MDTIMDTFENRVSNIQKLLYYIIYNIDININIDYTIYCQLKESIRKGVYYLYWKIIPKWKPMVMNGLGYFGIPTPLKKNFKKWEEGEHWPKPITPRSPL